MNEIISDVQIVPIRPNAGHVAFASCQIFDCFYLGSISIHSSPTHPLGFRTVFPTKRLSSGQEVPIVYPYTKAAEEAVTSAIVNKYLELMDNFDQVK